MFTVTTAWKGTVFRKSSVCRIAGDIARGRFIILGIYQSIRAIGTTGIADRVGVEKPIEWLGGLST